MPSPNESDPLMEELIEAMNGQRQIPPLRDDIDPAKITEAIVWLHEAAWALADGTRGVDQIVCEIPQIIDTLSIVLKSFDQRITDIESRLSGGYKGAQRN